MNSRPQGVRLFPLPRPGEPEEEVAHLIWAAGGRTDLEEIDEPKEMLKRADREEYHRLLYVAMTRARDRLYVCGWQGQKDKPEGESLVRAHQRTGSAAALSRSQIPMAPPCAEWSACKKNQSRTASLTASKALCLRSRLGPQPREARADAEKAHAVARRASRGGEGVEAPFAFQPPLGPRALAADHHFARGRLVHALLQHLPEIAPENQEQAARAFVSAQGGGLEREICRTRSSQRRWPLSATLASPLCSDPAALRRCRMRPSSGRQARLRARGPRSTGSPSWKRSC